MVRVEGGRVDRRLQVEPAEACCRKTCSDHWSCWSPPGVPKASTGRRRGRRAKARASSAAACRGASAWGVPPRARTSGARVPSGEAELRGSPASSGASRRSASPRRGSRGGRRRRRGTCRRGVGSPPPGSASNRVLLATIAGSSPPGPGRSSPEASPPISAGARPRTRARADRRAGRRRSRGRRTRRRGRRRRASRPPRPRGRSPRRQVIEAKPVEQGQLLEEDRPLAPRAALEDRVSRGSRARPAARGAPRTRSPGRSAVSRPSSAATKRSIASATNPRYHASSPLPSGSRAPPRRRSRARARVAEERARARRRKVELGRPRPLGPEHRLHRLDHRRDPREDRIAVLRVADRRRGHLRERHGPELAEQEHPGGERAGDGRGQDAAPRDELEPARGTRSIVAAAGAVPCPLTTSTSSRSAL